LKVFSPSSKEGGLKKCSRDLLNQGYHRSGKSVKSQLKKYSLRKVRENGSQFNKISYFLPNYHKNCPLVVIETPRR